MLYQQGTQRIEVIVRKEGGTGVVGAKEVPSTDAGGKGGEAKNGGLLSTLTGSSSPARQYRVIKTNLTHMVATAKQVGFQTATYYLSGTAQRTGDQSLQQSVMRQMEIVKDTTGLASSVVMGAVYGSWGGPIGTAIGAVLGATTTAVSTAIKYADRNRDFNFKRFKQDNAIEYQRARANINLTTGRLR